MTELGSCSVSLSYLGDEGDMRKNLAEQSLGQTDNLVVILL